jgi:O-antigen/teichoic acid export membrane protein
MTPPSLRDRAVGALSWSLADSFGSQVVQFSVAIMLARLLMPDDFGLIGMLVIFTAVAVMLIEAGFTTALIQKRELEPGDRSSVFWFNLAVSLVLATTMFALAPTVATFYGRPDLEPVARALSTLFVIHGCVAVQNALLTRALDFRTIAISNLSAIAVSSGIALYMATHGHGVWSLVAQQVSAAVVRAAVMWGLSPWRPRLHVSVASLRSLFGFGSRMAASGLLDNVFTNLYSVVIGRVYGAADLGIYSRANWFTQVPMQTLSQVVGRVIFPVLSSVQDEPERLQRAMAHALRVLALLGAPMMVGMAVVAEPLVRVVLTDKWLPAVPLIQLLCVVGLLYPLHLVNLNLLMAKGRSDLFLRLEIIKKALMGLALLVTWPFGMDWMIIGQIVVSLLAYFLNSYWTTRFVGYGPARQFRDTGPYLLAAILMGGVVLAIGEAGISRPAAELATQVGSGAVVYAAVCLAFRLQAVEDIRVALRDRLVRR